MRPHKTHTGSQPNPDRSKAELDRARSRDSDSLRCAAGRFEDLGSLELQPGFILTDAHEVRHFFGASSREEQKKWVACLRGLTSLNDSLTSIGETLEDGQVMAMQRRSRMCSVAPVPARPAVPGAGNAERSWWQRRA